MDGEGDQFHVVFYMLSTLGGTVYQSTAAGKATEGFRRENLIISILDEKVSCLLLNSQRIYTVSYSTPTIIGTYICLTAYGCLSLLGHHLCHKYSLQYQGKV